jgi:fatty-acyl-CoA synthase
MLKYWDNPEATNQVLDNARWMHTGDLAMIDEDGYIHISGRIKDLIIRGGENIAKRNRRFLISISKCFRCSGNWCS